MRHRDPTASKANGGVDPNMPCETTESQEHRIAEAAYFLAESRGFGGDHALDDWLQAEAMIKAEHTKREPHPISF